jgi:methylmalonyl-CoA epimerase
MRAILDHVGIAIRDLEVSLAFFRDAFGFEIQESEEVASQRVRAHFLPAGGPKLELLEATAADSAIAKYIDKRGPGLHHIAFRVDNIEAALADLKQRGIRLIDEKPRPGAEHALVAFIHPSAAHGVLVELKQPLPVERRQTVTRALLGDLELISVYDGFFAVDGGSLFGIVPKTLWSAKAHADDRNRVTLAIRPLIVRGARTMLIDAGIGDKDAGGKLHEIYAVDRARHLDHALAEAGLSVQDIDIVLATHLHFDHAGGFTRRDASGRVVPRFPRAQYVVRRGEWEAATETNARTHATYLPDNYLPLAEAGVLQLVDEDSTIMPGVKVRRTGGHTRDHQMVLIESRGEAAAFTGDLMPTTLHVADGWGMGGDLYPLETLSAKQAFVGEAVARSIRVFFEHDLLVPSGFITEADGSRSVRQTL